MAKVCVKWLAMHLPNNTSLTYVCDAWRFSTLVISRRSRLDASCGIPHMGAAVSHATALNNKHSLSPMMMQQPARDISLPVALAIC